MGKAKECVLNKEFSGIGRVLPEICPRILVDCSTIDEVDPEECALRVDKCV